MAFPGFGKGSGPSVPPKSLTPFGHFTRPPSPSPPFADAAPQRSLRGLEAPERMRSPPLALESTRSVVGLSNPSAGVHRPIGSSPRWGDEHNLFLRDYDAQTHQMPSVVAPYVALNNSRTSIPAKIPQFQDLKRTRSPPLPSVDKDNSRNSSQNAIGRPTSSSPAWGNRPRLPVSYADLLTHPEQSPALPDVDSYGSGRKYPPELADVQYPKRTRSPPVPSSDEVFQDNSPIARNDVKRPSLSPPRLGTRSNVPFHSSDPQTQKTLPSAHNNDAEAAATKPTSFSVPKRARSPPVPSSNQVFQGNSYSTQDETEREMQAKAKRLARFKVELNETVSSSPEIANLKFSGNRHDQSTVENKKYVGELPVEAAGDFPNGSVSADYDGLESSSIIIGLCPDMCPESERSERERKGDLDQYERLDGDRNQTSKLLAVKKYTRTAEREADLIRPMPILQKTIDYLLSLLDQQYDERFLGMYNFLWDRMRAIRMDLRMQHIFNVGAITMLEKMIRLHIIAMHELCEYTKGEGFSEGFDAHLNIEQMNKTSVELFQMYDDHRKNGINVPTEKEFRGYYALLKLDKHPGYKVEPAELSLDLAKMTPEIRQTPEVLFARDVARACRTGNFIAFFRLARKASYLQACLMHAHFAKLRTHALASLHCGLQNNQGLPVAHVAKWLGLEEEDIESLLEYHGFLIKEFEEPYMVKEGLFINGDKDYPTKCSKLVHLKKSSRITGDISSSHRAASLPAEEEKEPKLGKVYKHDRKAVQFVETESSVRTIDEEMSDFEAVSSPKHGTQVQQMLKASTGGQQSGDNSQVAGVYLSPQGFSFAHSFLESRPAKVVGVEKPNSEALFRNSPDSNVCNDMEAMPLQIVSRQVVHDISPGFQLDSAMENSVPQNAVTEDLEGDKPTDIHQEAENSELVRSYHDEEAAVAKLKLILRIWRRRSSKLRELREQRLLAANAALTSLSLGPSIRRKKDERSTLGEFDIDHVMRERHEKHEQSWSRLNVSDVIVGQLMGRNPEAKCLCFKIIVCTQMNNPGNKCPAAHLAAGSWLRSKLMPTRKDDDNDADLVISSPGLSIWKKWVPGEAGTDLTCCLSVIKDIKFDNLNEEVLGASAVLFLVSESIPWELQKIQLHDLLMSLPSGCQLPLLVLSGSCKEEVSDPAATIVSKLGLHQIDKSRISSILIVFLVGSQQMEHLDGFFSDKQLREGLQWLASETPIQPILHCVKTCELALTHLNSSLEALDETSIYEVGPDHCISVFNESLDRSLQEVAEAANENPISWPCPEIALLEESSDEHKAAELYLPSIGWSSAAKTELLKRALRDCKIPAFPDDISWLGIGSNTGKEIEIQRSRLENCLIRYLTQSCKMMGLMLATNEAVVMLQKNAQLELHNSSFYIVPKWVMIFRRIFNWRLMSLSSGPFSSAYVLERHTVASPSSRGLVKLKVEGSISSTYNLINPSLDEMVEVGCTPMLSRKIRPEPEPFQTVSGTVSNGPQVLEATNISELIGDEPLDGELIERGNRSYLSSVLNNPSDELVVATMVKKEADKLSKLLEHCSELQNRIDEKLLFYF